MSNKNIKLKSVKRNVRKNTRASRSETVRVKKTDNSVKKIDNLKVEVSKEQRLEEAKKTNTVVLSTPATPKAAPVQKKPVNQQPAAPAASESKEFHGFFYWFGT
ncbi:MAG: hypothetical protein KBS81_09035, partial [Spirochaetales bacterium]|nr:hypothetical protein [Candidatus Physcosoma equi]